MEGFRLMADKTVMIVDDSVTQVTTIKYVLSNSGYEVLTASDGKEGLQELNKAYENNKEVRLIISDINMPNMGGISFIREVRKDDRFKFIPIIVLTTEGDDEMKEKGKESGASAWIVKPFQPEKLVGLIDKFLS